jgi:hypothetical protein
LRAAGRSNAEGAKKTRTRERPKAVPAPEANAELQVNIDVCHITLTSFFYVRWLPHQRKVIGGGYTRLFVDKSGLNLASLSATVPFNPFSWLR